MDTPLAGSLIAEPAQTILVVDDDVHVLKLLARMLGMLGYVHVLQASSIEEAMQLFKANADRIRLVISDFVMPSGTGDRLVVELRKLKPTLPALIISGNDPAGLNSAVPLDPAVNFLQKPFTVSDMSRMIANLGISA